MHYLNRILLILLVGWLCFPAFAQTQQLNGQVVDSLNRAIPYANVLAINQSTQKIGAFAITNPEGKFKLALVPGQQFLIRVSFVGFKLHEQEIGDWSADAGLKIVLRQDETSLDLVEVVSEMPVTMKGDTLTYKTDAFTTGTERKLGDVLEKLPGFQVDENGEVKVQGKKVDKVLVDGKSFFDGDTKLATKNLPANAVDRVQVLKNFNEVSPIRGLDNDETLALNIQLKDGKKKMIFGDLEAGLGPQNRYLTHANTFYYAPKLNVNLIGGNNNVGEQTFTLQDYFRFSGGMGGLGVRSGSRVQSIGDDLGIPMANRTNAAQLTTHLGALNLNFTPSKKWRQTGFLIGSASDNELGSNSLRTYLNAGENVQENLISNTQIQNKSVLGKYAVTFTPQDETYLKYSFFGKYTEITNQSDQKSNFGQNIQSISSLNYRNPSAFQQKLEWYHAPSERHVFSTEFNWERKFTDPVFDLQTNLIPLLGLVIIPNSDSYRLLQSQELSTKTLEGVLNYYYILNPTNHLNWSFGAQRFSQRLTGSLAQQGVDAPFLRFQNENEFELQDVYGGMTWKSKLKKWVFSPSLVVHRYAWKDLQILDQLQFSKVLALPGMYAKWSIKSNRSLTYRFQTEANFMDIQKLAQGLVLQDYNAVFLGNRQLDNGFFDSHFLNYNYFDLFSGLTLFGNLSYQRKRNEIAVTTDFAGINRLLSVLNTEPVNESLNGDIRVDKVLNKMKIELGGRWNAFSTNLLLDEIMVQNQQFSQVYDSKITTTFFKKLEVDLGYSLLVNSYQSGLVKNTFAMHSPKLEIDFDVLKGLKLKVDYTYNSYSNQVASTRYDFDFLNAFLFYRKKSSPWEFKASVWNIFDTRQIRRDSFSENLISTYSYFVQPRYGLLSIKWDI